ncbi:coiled-coil domain containing 59 [Columba livia]|uniref:Coiled-coil domain containing 59 n=1 Tax=Columba livia TaxID=8932 RepID=A0A2I0LUY9_COLLI|nr:thyroid transcription factor 1-associated protein 26 [Columba livia]PKK21244.1 coiled-coil domain containing 59 [Columba livia]
MTVPNTPHHPAEDERFGGRHRHEKEEVASAEADEWNENVGMAAERQRFLLRNVVGSLQEGRGFAFRRKQQIERQYRKLLKKRKVPSQQDDQFTDTYPEHLKHLYLAEEEMLKKRRRAPDAAVLSEEKLNEAEE